MPMKASLYHVKLNVDDVNFYKELLGYLDFGIISDTSNSLGASDGKVSIWVTKAEKPTDFNYQETGLNHLAFRVSSREDVNKFYKEFIKAKTLKVLDEPKEYSKYNHGKGYYAVFFEDPDHIKLEVCWKAE